MIRPKPKPGKGTPRAIAFMVTAALLLGAQVGLKGISVPALASSREMIRELDPLLLERFTASGVPEESGAPAEEEGADEEEAREEVVAAPTFEQEVGTAMEDLERRFSDEPVVTPEVEGTDDEELPATGIAADAGDARFESLFGAADEIVVGRATRGRTPSDGAGLGIGITERVADTDEGAAGRVGGQQPGVTVETSAGRNRPADEEVEIGDVESESFDGSEVDLLAGWMRANASDLPVGVRVHVNFQPSFLTAAAEFTADGRPWELFLMLNETLQELHIVLIEGDRSVYLIDRGFQELSRSLREGTVRRDQGRIVAIDSRTGAASGERAQDFYSVFLSWWEAVKADVRTQ